MGRGELFSAFIEHARGLLKLPPSDNTSHGRTQLNISKIPLLHVISSFFVCLYAFFLPERQSSIVLFFALIFASDANAAFLQVLSKVCCIRVM